MATISELREEIRKEKGFYENEREINAFGEEKKKLERELKELRFNRKYGKSVQIGKKVFSGAKEGFKKLSNEFGKVQRNTLAQDRQKKEVKETKENGLGLFKRW